MWLYQGLNVLSTILEAIGLYIISGLLLKSPRRNGAFYKAIPPVAIAVAAFGLTWFTQLGAYKMPLLFIFITAVLKMCYKDSVYQSIAVVELWSVGVSFLAEAVSFICVKLLHQDIQVVIDGQGLPAWEVYIGAMIARVLIIVLICILFKDFRYTIRFKDCALLTVIFLNSFFTVLFLNYNILNLAKAPDIVIYAASMVLSVSFLMIFLYSKNTLYLREQERQQELRIERMKQQLAYYQEKLKDEERVRSVYHDMKNTLLVLKRQINAPEAAGMLERLESQVAVYEDYVHTGNDILDMILKEKSELAREKQIALSITAGFDSIDFIEPLDIITIFGNGLDNAIEASETLTERERVILVKAGKVQNFISILMENNCAKIDTPAEHCTSKPDDFLHGFGISNMKKTAEKYNGQLTTKCENGEFTLKILIPIP